MTKLRMLYDRLLVRVISEEKTKSGLFIPQIAREGSPWRSAEVVSVGAGRLMRDGTLAKLQVKEGDCIWFFRAVGSGVQVAVEIDGEELLVIPEEHVMAIVPPAALKRDTGLVDAAGRGVIVAGAPS